METKKKTPKVVIVLIAVLLLPIVVYAATLLFDSLFETSQLTPSDYFKIDLTTGMVPTEMMPGKSFTVEPVVTNDATYEMYVFIAVEMPSVDDESVYDYTVGEEWTLVERTAEKSIWAYASGGSMTVLSLDESTASLTTQMTMKNISNTEFVGLDDINITITGYGIGTEDVSTDPEEAWTYCKQVGNIE